MKNPLHTIGQSDLLTALALGVILILSFLAIEATVGMNGTAHGQSIYGSMPMPSGYTAPIRAMQSPPAALSPNARRNARLMRRMSLGNRRTR